MDNRTDAQQAVWHASYPPGVPHTINPDSYGSVAELFEESLRRHASRPFSVCMDQWMSYGELDDLSAAFGVWLQSLNLEAGARVAIMLPNLPQFAVVQGGVVRTGLVCVNVNPLYTARELEHQLKDSGASVIVVLENFARTLSEVVEKTAIKHVVLTAVGDLLGSKGKWISFAARHLAKMVPPYKLPLAGGLRVTTLPQALAQGARGSLKPVQVDANAPMLLQYTGGTTGLSKGAVLTHRNVIAAVLQGDAWLRPALEADGLHASQANVILALPMYHIFAGGMCFQALRWGAQVTLVPNPRDFGKFIEVLKKRPFHVLPAVNTLFNALLQHPQFKTLDFSGLKLSLAGGMAATEGTARQWLEVTGCTMLEGWGMSETGATGTLNPTTVQGYSGNIGLPLPGVSIAIKDDDGNSLPLGEAGEICIKGPNVMAGYYKQPQETARAFTADGYMRTGDVGVMDAQGFTKIVDRKKDMILVSGFNVFPSELENVISMCDGIVECAVIGIADEKQGEAIKVFAVRSDHTLTEEDVLKYCQQNLTGYKRPKYIEFRDELPKSAVGKILRRELRAGK
jgi:acyl-CoA synthetase (AMP-forming)/AMP-acid ligase II